MNALDRYGSYAMQIFQEHKQHLAREQQGLALDLAAMAYEEIWHNFGLGNDELIMHKNSGIVWFQSVELLGSAMEISVVGHGDIFRWPWRYRGLGLLVGSTG